MDSITLKNKNGLEVTFGELESDFFLLEFEDSGIPIGISSSKGVRRNGESYIGSTTNKRQFRILFGVDFQLEEQFVEKRRLIAKVLDPNLGQATLLYKGYSIKVAPDNTPKYKEIDSLYHESSITLVAHDPYWSSQEELRVDIVSWIPNLEYPLDIPTAGFEIEIRDPYKLKNVSNPGDIEIGILIDIIINSETVSPLFTNVTSGRTIGLVGQFMAGDRITLNTRDREKESKVVKANGTIEYMAINGDWDFNLLPDYNTISYAATKGEDTMEANFRFIPKYQEV